MARIKMEAALETSGKWQITDVSLLHWRKKLKCAARDCNDAARRCRKLSEEEDEKEHLGRQSSFPRRIAHATSALVSSFVGSNNNNDHCSAGHNVIAAVRKFERLADGASEFMRFVHLGGMPRWPHLFFDPLIGHMFSGESLMYEASHPGGQYHCFGIGPMCFKDRGLEALLSFTYQDCKVPKNNVRLGFILRLSESTDIIGTIVKCLQLVTPHFKSMADVAIKEITQLPTQDFACVPAEVANAQMEQWNPGLWNHVHKSLTGWYRQDPLCCQGYEHKGNESSCGGGSSNDIENYLRLSSIFPEPVCLVFLQRHISLSEYNNLVVPVSSSTSSVGYDDTFASLDNSPLLKLGFLFLPHDSLEEDPKYAVKAGYAIEAIDEEKHQHLTHMFLPQVVDYLYHNVKATTYQICWRSNHGSAHLWMEKIKMVRAHRSMKGRNTKKVLHPMLQGPLIRKVRWKETARDFLKLWVVRSSEKLQSSISAYIGEKKAIG
ncbi:hypothetical protein BRADI_2g60540v3 [Brachypodium distachyon]|uniref:Uncharacterized protein n=1 Tax=Brachypodium distachyon TaxID=15368 RepID=A0A0Q3J0K5_BRADI|nr:hypothetical protein BRADI_2g60540v3 [Brachypodium distachyon]